MSQDFNQVRPRSSLIRVYAVCMQKAIGPLLFTEQTGLNYNHYVSLPSVHPSVPHRLGGNRKRYKQSTNTNQKSIETVFSIPICRQCGDKWRSKTLFLLIFDLRSSIVLAFSIAAYPVWVR